MRAKTNQTDQPLVPREPNHLECLAANLDDQSLDANREKHDVNEELVVHQSLERVGLIVHFARVHFVRQLSNATETQVHEHTTAYLHEHKRVEHHREVLCWF